jgi:hypothetical protein
LSRKDDYNLEVNPTLKPILNVRMRMISKKIGFKREELKTDKKIRNPPSELT